MAIYLLWLWPHEITGHYMSVNKKIFYPDSLLNFRTVGSITGHLATLIADGSVDWFWVGWELNI